MKIYINSKINSMTIDVGLRQITIDLPPDLPAHEVSDVLQSETVLTIIRQLVGEPLV